MPKVRQDTDEFKRALKLQRQKSALRAKRAGSSIKAGMASLGESMFGSGMAAKARKAEKKYYQRQKKAMKGL